MEYAHVSTEPFAAAHKSSVHFSANLSHCACRCLSEIVKPLLMFKYSSCQKMVCVKTVNRNVNYKLIHAINDLILDNEQLDTQLLYFTICLL